MIRSLIIPKFAVRSDQEIRESMARKFVPFFIVSVVTVIIYCIAAPYFFKIFFPKYESIVAYSQVLSLSVLFMPFILQTQALVTLNKTKDLYILHISKPFIKGGLLLLLVPQWGIWGAVYSLLLFYVIHYSSLWYLYSRT